MKIYNRLSAFIPFFLILLHTPVASASPKNGQSARNASNTIENHKAQALALSDRYIHSITNVCDGKLLYLRLKFSDVEVSNRSAESENIKNNKHIVLTISSNRKIVRHDLMQFNQVGYVKSVRYYPARTPTEAERLNGVTYRGSSTFQVELRSSPSGAAIR